MYYYSLVLPGSFCTRLQYPIGFGFLLAPHSQDLSRSFDKFSFLRLSALDFHVFFPLFRYGATCTKIRLDVRLSVFPPKE
jgi:hypothetical protein